MTVNDWIRYLYQLQENGFGLHQVKCPDAEFGFTPNALSVVNIPMLASTLEFCEVVGMVPRTVPDQNPTKEKEPKK